MRPKDLPEPEQVSPFAHLDERKAAIYENLRDLQFEYRVGKLSDADYQTVKQDLQKELANVLAEVDKLRATLPNAPVPRNPGRRRQAALLHLPHLQRDLRQGPQVLRRVRQTHEGGPMRTLCVSVSLCQILAFSLQAAVTGTVINATTGKPQAGATVALNKLGQQNGIELIDQAKSDAQGRFSIDQPVQGPHLIRTAFDGVTYNHMLRPGLPTTDIKLEVFNASKDPGAAKVTKHMILFEPGPGR